MSDWLTPKQVAAQCGIALRTVYEWRKRQYGPPFEKVGGRIRYFRGEFSAWRDGRRGASD